MHARTPVFYSNSPLYFGILLIVALVGFFPSYYGRIGDAKMVHQFHGAMATLWMLLLIGQGWLMRTRRLTLHRAVGKASILLATLFVISGFVIVHDMLTREGHFAKVFGPRLVFVDLSTILFFAFAYGMAIYYRKQMQLHARFMVCTALPLIPPALVRIAHRFLPAMTFDQGFHACFIVTDLIVLALIFHDSRTGKVRAPYVILLAVLLMQHAAFEFSLKLGLWRDVVAWIAAR